MNTSVIHDLRTKYLDPNDIYLATIDMSNGVNPFLHYELVASIQSTPMTKPRTLQLDVSNTLCNADESFQNAFVFNLIDWAVGNTPNRSCSSTRDH